MDYSPFIHTNGFLADELKQKMAKKNKELDRNI
jgi:hypothetical protein